MFTIDQLHEYNPNLLDDNYYTLVSNRCNHCQYPIIINTDRTIMKCANKHCPEHLSYRAENMFKDMGIRDIGAKTAYRMIKENKLKSHMDILSLTIDQMPSNSSPSVNQRRWHELQKGRKQSLSKILKLYQLNDIAEQKANKIVEGYSSFEEFFAENDEIIKMMKHVLKSLNQSNTTYHLSRMCLHILSAKDDLIRIEKLFDITRLSDEKIRLCVTGEISSVYMDSIAFKPREKFIEILNEKYAGIVSFVSSGRNVTDANFLLTDSTRMTGKYADAKANGIMILPFASFCEYLEYKYGPGNEDYELKRRS